MSEIINHLQRRVEETKRELQSVTDRVQQAIADRDLLGSELQGYEKTLSAEMRREGGGPTPPTPTRESSSIPESDNGQNVVNKAEFARRFVREHATTGVTPAELFNGFMAAGIATKKPYIYSLVQRLQSQNAIRSRRGKYYPAEQPNETARETTQ